MRLLALAAAIFLAAACGTESRTDPELEALKKKKDAEEKLRAEATKPKPPEPQKPVPSKEELTGKCKSDGDGPSCQGACALEDFESCFLMARLYEDGKGGVPVDYEAAREFLERGCEGGHGQSCYAAATYYDYGKTVNKSPRTAQEYFKKACDLKVEAGCKELKPK